MINNLKFDNNGLIPVIIQDFQDNIVLMQAYMNKESLEKTLETQQTWFFSRSRNKLWHKGEESGHLQNIKEILVDCDNDSLLIKVEQVGDIACHTGERSRFFTKLEGN